MGLVYILAFGVLGVVARYGVGLTVSAYFASEFPWATFGINIIGSFLIGVIYVTAAERSMLSPELKVGLMVGLLGGFTTFSAYCLETFRMVEEGRYFYAALYWVSSPVCGVGAAFAGAFIMRKLFGVLG